MSDFIPNTFQTPNAIVDRLMELLSDSELRVLLYTIRHVLGWQKKIAKRKATISISNFVKGFSYTDEKGKEHIYSGCGLKEATVRSALQSLEQYRILKATGTSVHGREWELAFMTDDNVDFGGLISRLYEKNQKGKAKISQAREANPKITPPVQQNPSCVTEVDPSCSTEPLPSCVTEDNESHIETQDKPIIAVEKQTATNGKVSKEEYELFMGAIESVLKVTGSRKMDYYHLLHGTSKKKQFVMTTPYFANSPMDSQELCGFGSWYVIQCPNASVPTAAEKLEDWVIRFRQSKVVTPRKASTDDNPAFYDEIRALKGLSNGHGKK